MFHQPALDRARRADFSAVGPNKLSPDRNGQPIANSSTEKREGLQIDSPRNGSNCPILYVSNVRRRTPGCRILARYDPHWIKPDASQPWAYRHPGDKRRADLGHCCRLPIKLALHRLYSGGSLESCGKKHAAAKGAVKSDCPNLAGVQCCRLACRRGHADHASRRSATVAGSGRIVDPG